MVMLKESLSPTNQRQLILNVTNDSVSQPTFFALSTTEYINY
jgi:hypothetical protein